MNSNIFTLATQSLPFSPPPSGCPERCHPADCFAVIPDSLLIAHKVSPRHTMKLFLLVLAGIVALASCEVELTADESNQVRESEEEVMIVKRGAARYDLNNYKKFKQGTRGWTGANGEKEEE
eukprot:sb/3475917/